MSAEWGSAFRARRIVELLQAKDQLSIADFRAIQYDNANLFARDVVPVLKDVPLDRPEVAQARDRLVRWNCQHDLNRGPVEAAGGTVIVNATMKY